MSIEPADQLPGVNTTPYWFGHASRVRCLAWSRSGKNLATGTIEGTIHVWKVAHQSERISVDAFSSPVCGLAWSPDGSRLASLGVDGFLRIWSSRDGSQLGKKKAHKNHACSLAWHPNKSIIATSGQDCQVKFWDSQTLCEAFATIPLNAPARQLSWGAKLTTGGDDGKLVTLSPGDTAAQIIKPTRGPILALTSSTDLVASAGRDKIVRIWQEGRVTASLEGHLEPVLGLSFSSDGKLLASRAETVRFWRTDTWDCISAFSPASQLYGSAGIAFSPSNGLLATTEDEGLTVRLWDIDSVEMLANARYSSSIRIVSAKVVFVGESNVGKSCLALRLAEDRYEAQGPTHGMRIWTIAPDKLDPHAKTPTNERRELVLWDLGGHEEYRLVHQLFLHDTTLALVLLTPDRGVSCFREAEEWDNRLEKQFNGRKVVKILVGTKHDLNRTSPIDKQKLRQFIKSRSYRDFIYVSAKDGHGMDNLKQIIARSLDWSTLGKTRRPELFQRIREVIEHKKEQGYTVLFLGDLIRQIATEYPEAHSEKAVDSVVEQLALQGVITQVYLGTGDRVLVLRIDILDRYAGSLVILARDNKRRVPAIELAAIGSAKLVLPGIPPSERLPRDRERFLLESVVQLFIERGICLSHEGLLIFPSLFEATEASSPERIPHSIVLGYDFSGAISNIYAALVTSLAVSGQFGRLKLWNDRVEFESATKAACGIRKVEPDNGPAHIDVYFDDRVTDAVKQLFISFVENHISQSGVNIIESISITCRCGFGFPEDLIRDKLLQGLPSVLCPSCENRTFISEGAKRIRHRNPELDGKTWALKTRVEEKKREISRHSIRELGGKSVADSESDFIWILHLSDIHITESCTPETMLQALSSDLRDKVHGLGIDKLDYLVISGDLSDRARPVEFELASRLVSKLIEKFRLTSQRCIIIPGNHDVDWETDVYTWKGRRPGDTSRLSKGSFVEQDKVLGIRNDSTYGDRLKNFSNHLFHPLIQQPYPLDHREQCIPYLFSESKLQFLAMNSCWEIDEHFRKRSGINPVALANGLEKATEQIESATRDGLITAGDKVLKIAIWHHAITGNEKIEDDSFLDHLYKQDFRIALHGDVHERRDDLIRYLDPQRRIYVVGAGAFGATSSHRPESTPNFYQVLRVRKDLSSVRVYTRHKNKQNGGWEGWACYRTEDKFVLNTHYDIPL